MKHEQREPWSFDDVLFHIEPPPPKPPTTIWSKLENWWYSKFEFWHWTNAKWSVTDCQVMFLNNTDKLAAIWIFSHSEIHFTYKRFHAGKRPSIFIFLVNTSPVWWQRYGIRFCLPSKLPKELET